MTFYGLCHLMDKSVRFPQPELCRCRNSRRLPLSVLLVVWKLFLAKNTWNTFAPLPTWKLLPKSLFSLFFFSPFSFLADLMDNSELIRNVTLCGHLHHGKVRELLATWNRVSFCFLSFHHRLGFEPIRLDLLNLRGLHAHCETLLWHSHFFVSSKCSLLLSHLHAWTLCLYLDGREKIEPCSDFICFHFPGDACPRKIASFIWK